MTRRSIIASLINALLLQQCACATSQSVESTTAVQLYDTPNLPLEVFILDVQNGSTTAKLVCPADSTAAGCDQQLMNNYTFGPGVFRVQASLDGQYTVTSDCSTASHTAVCRCFESDDSLIYPHSTTLTDYTTSYTTTFGPSDVTVSTLPIVSGLDKLPRTSTMAGTNTGSPSSPSPAPSPTQVVSTSSTSTEPMETVSSGSSATITVSYLSELFVFGTAIFALV